MRKALLLLILTGCITGEVALPQETGEIGVFFCDQEDCAARFDVLARSAGSLDCAMYHPTERVVKRVLEKGRLVVDGAHGVAGAVIEDRAGLMHDKFCIVNKSVVWTGSWNPAQGMTIANNVVVVGSATLARAYQEEFDELARGTFQRGKRGSAQVLFNGNLTEAYFCPEDDCKERILKLLGEAGKSVHVMAYAFTDDDIGRLLEGKEGEGLDVRVIFDPRKDKYSEYERLKGVSRIAKVHHKVFIIDGETVITGSMNPTRNGDEGNDENILLLREADVVKAFEEEFERLWLT